MADYRCKFCDYFLCSSELKGGNVRVICRNCKAGQVVIFKEPKPAGLLAELTQRTR